MTNEGVWFLGDGGSAVLDCEQVGLSTFAEAILRPYGCPNYLEVHLNTVSHSRIAVKYRRKDSSRII